MTQIRVYPDADGSSTWEGWTIVTGAVGKDVSPGPDRERAHSSVQDGWATWDDELGYYGDDELGELMELRSAAVQAGDMDRADEIESQMRELEVLIEARAAAVLAGEGERAQDIERQMDELLAPRALPSGPARGADDQAASGFR